MVLTFKECGLDEIRLSVENKEQQSSMGSVWKAEGLEEKVIQLGQ